jgi:ribonuclease-3
MKLPQPRYAIVREKGPEHSKVFTVEVRVGKEWNGQADGRTKKVAAQRAARGVYDRLRHASEVAVVPPATVDEPESTPASGAPPPQ